MYNQENELLKQLRREYIMPRRKKNSLMDFFMMQTQEVLDKFASLPGAQMIGKGDDQFVFVPGHRPDRVLLIAHSDTVFNDRIPEIGYANDIFFSLNDSMGIGADDRAGCAILWSLKDMGHSLLIPNKEECGCKGSRFLVKQAFWRDEILKHQFAIQFDRMNGTDIVTYEVGSKEIENWLESKLQTKKIKYKTVGGMHTDICVLLDQDNHSDEQRQNVICGTNLSIGYYGQHGSNEILFLSEWQRTLSLVRKLLSEKDIPKFVQKLREKKSWTNNHNTYNRTSGYENIITNYGKNNINDHNIMLESYLTCPSCNVLMDSIELNNNEGKCVNCNKKVIYETTKTSSELTKPSTNSDDKTPKYSIYG